MLDELHITDLGVIEDVTLPLGPGLTVVTGETGAGKTMLVTALQLLRGARASSTLVRRGTSAARIEARWAPAPPSTHQHLDDGTDELVITRDLLAEGRSRVRINGRLAPVSALSPLLVDVLEIHAQHEHARVTRPEVQRDLLDQFAGATEATARLAEPETQRLLLDGLAGAEHAAVLTSYRNVHGRWRAAVGRRDEIIADAHERARTAERLRHELDEIDAYELDHEVDDDLADRLDVLEQAEGLQDGAAEAVAALDEDGARDGLVTAFSTLRRMRVEDPTLEALRDRVEALLDEVGDVASELQTWAEGLDVDVREVEALRERHRGIQALRRKYGADVEAILAYRDEADSRLDQLDRDADDVEVLAAEIAQLAGELRTLAQAITTGRRVAADELGGRVAGHLADLAMPHAEFRVVLDTSESAEDFGPHGADRVAFELAANPGEPGGPIDEVASGGERSRVALAVAVALADVHDAEVLVFDEVDAGVGGATAMQVGAKLARLAVAGRQVLCVTHLAQLAAFADAHAVVTKDVRDGRTVTEVRVVADADRVDELARMLSGDAGGEAGREHARRLLAEARTRSVPA